MKILVISSGGTICCKNENSIITSGEGAYERLLADLDGCPAEFSFFDAADLPSENNNGRRISHIVNTVLDFSGRFDGIVLLHGTDTLQYTAAALSYACGSGCAPVIAVSANYVLSDSRTNGFENFRCAVRFICGGHGTGVFAAYKNENAPCAVHRASRLLLHSDYSDCLYSVSGQIYGSFQNGVFVKNKGYRALKDEAPPFGRISLSDYSGKIAVIHARPGLKYPEISEKTQAVLIRAYHSGTLPSSDDSFTRFVNSLKRNQIECFLSGGSGSVYESSAKFGEMGITTLPPAAFPAQYMKLWLALDGGRNAKNTLPLSIGEDKIPNF